MKDERDNPSPLCSFEVVSRVVLVGGQSYQRSTFVGHPNDHVFPVTVVTTLRQNQGAVILDTLYKRRPTEDE